MGKWTEKLAIYICIWCICYSVAFATCDQKRVFIHTADYNVANFDAEIAKTKSERAKGLMYRQALPENQAMLFIYDSPRAVHFWMKNTYISLDIIFVNHNGYIEKIAKMTSPLDETPIYGGDNIQFVLEINGGLSDILGIRVGQKLAHPEINSSVQAQC